MHNSPGIENVDTEIFSQSLSSTPGRQKKPADWVKVRKKLPLVLDNNPEPQFEMPEPAIQESDPNETFTPFASDSPFFKVPLPPKPVKRPFRLKPRKKEELASSASETEQELHSEEEVPKVNQKGGLEDLYEKARYLVNWVPRMKSKKMIVEGDLLTLGSLSKKKNLPDDRWFTSRVIDRLRPNLILTKSGPYVLEGKMNYQAALQINAPQYIMTAFKNGFPTDWDHFRQEWRKFILQQRENEETISLCSTTMNSEQSHYLQATVSKISKTVDDEDDELVICKPRKNRFKKQMSGESELDEIENNVSSNVMKVKVQVHHTANKSNDLSLSETSFEKVVDKRKRKSKEFSDDEKKVVVKKKSRNRSKSNNEEESITSIVMPAKRGRPPKCSKQREEVDVQSLRQVDQSIDNSKARRGRPTKSSEREKSILHENTIAKTKVSQEESIVSIVMPAKRGRPPKSSKPKELDVDVQSSRQVDKSVDSSKARRGRPPKSSEREKSTLQNAEVSHDALKKNCRSKMGKDTIEKTVIENVDSKQEKRTKSSERNKPVKEKKRKSIEKVQSEKDSKRGRHQSKSTERKTLEIVNEQPEKSKPTKKENKTVKNVEKQNESPKRGGTRNQSKSAERENKRKSLENQEIFKEKTEKSKPAKKEKKKEKNVEKMPKKESPKRRGTRNQSKSTERENRKKSLENQEIFIEKTEKSKPTKKDTSEAAPKRKGRPPKNSKQGSVPSPGRGDTSDNSVTTNISVASKSRGRPRKSENEKKTNKKKVSKEPLPPYAAFKPKETMQENSNKVKKAKKEELHVKDLKSKPKSLKDAKKNEEILKAHNNDHQDDLFKAKKTTKKTTKKTAKKDTGKRASDILAEIFHDSDSEQNLSLHSAKTPILAFIDRSKTVQPEEDFEEDFEPR